MLASRANWKLNPNQLSQRLSAFKQSGIEVIDLSESNPTRCKFDYLKANLLVSLSDPENLVYEPDPKGMPEARRAIQNFYREKNVNVPLEHIFLTSSTSEAYSFLLRLLANPGERILMPRPSYPLLDLLADLNDIRLDPYEIRYEANQWQIHMESLIREIHSDTKAIVLINPNNPTGSCLKQNEAEKIVTLARDHSLVLISDEVFSDYVFFDDPKRIPTFAGITGVITFTLGGISKTLGLPQMKLGWILANGPFEMLSPLIQRLEIILDTYLSVNTPVQRSLASWFPLRHSIQKEIKDRIQNNLAFLRSCLTQPHPVHCLPLEAGWYAILRLPRTKSEEEWALEFLDQDRVYLYPGYFFDFEQEAFVVVSLLVPCEVFKEGISRILRRVKSG